MLGWAIQVLSLFLALSLTAASSDEILQEANASYQQGLSATSYMERKEAFNKALALYDELEKTPGENDPNLDRGLGDTYFQLEEYPWAILYYQRALNKKPDDPLLADRILNALKQLGLLSETSKPAVQNVFIGYLSTVAHNDSSLLYFFLITFFTCSSSIWLPHSWLRKTAAASFSIFLLLLVNCLVFYYLTPIDGILIASSGFYRAPDWSQPQLSPEPLIAGSKVRVLQTSLDGNWVKISNSDGMIGYIPTSHLRLY